jgi:hypothetical protein
MVCGIPKCTQTRSKNISAVASVVMFFLQATRIVILESQHKPTIEIGKAQEALKLSDCGWGCLVTYDLDLSWIHMHAIQIHHYKSIGEWSQDIVHHPHESGWSICQTQGHDQPFKKAFL